MMAEGLPRALRAIAGITAATGFVQMVRPQLVLGELTGDHAPLARHLFGTVGMFMTVAGATLHRSVAVPEPDRDLLRWAAVEKLGASTAVAIGVRRGLFSKRAIPVALFDLASAAACLAYSAQLSRAGGAQALDGTEA